MKMTFNMQLDLNKLTMKELRDLQEYVAYAIRDKEFEYSQISRDLGGWVKGMILMDGKLKAIVAYRNLKACSIIEAKNVVDKIADEMEGNVR